MIGVSVNVIGWYCAHRPDGQFGDEDIRIDDLHVAGSETPVAWNRTTDSKLGENQTVIRAARIMYLDIVD